MIFGSVGFKRFSFRNHLVEQSVDVCFGIEDRQVIDVFADTDITYREVKLLRYGDGYAAFSSTVEFGQDDTRNIRCLQELPRLFETILSCYGVDYEQRLMRRAIDFTAGD